MNGEKQRDTKLYVVELLTIWGETKMVRAFGMDKITERVPYICFDGFKHLFSDRVQNVWEKVTRRPEEAVELLVGAEVASYFPTTFESWGQLAVMNSIFASGYPIFGMHPEIRAEGMKFSEEVKMIRQTGVKVTTQYAN